MTIESVPRALVPALLRLAAPVALSRLGLMGMGIVDTIVVGQAASRELPYLALGWAPTGVMLVTGIGLMLGVQVLGARAIGAGQPRAAGGVLRKGLAIALGFGAAAGLVLWFATGPVLGAAGIAPDLVRGAEGVARILALSIPFQFAFTALSYFLEAVQRPAATTIVIWSANALNVALLFWLVPHMGAQGAAWATLLARAVMAIALAGWLFWTPLSRAYGLWPGQRADASSYRAILAVGGAAALSQFAEAMAFSAMSVIAGRVGGEAVAAYQIMLMTLALVFMVALGMTSATAVLVAEAHGRRDAQGASRAAWHGLALNAVAMAAASALLLLAAAPIAHAFTKDAAIAALFIAASPLLALAPVPDGGQSVAAGALRARGDNWFPTASHLLAYVVIMPPLGFALSEVHGRGVAGLIEAIVIASVVSVLVLVIRLIVLDRGARTRSRA